MGIAVLCLFLCVHLPLCRVITLPVSGALVSVNESLSQQLLISESACPYVSAYHFEMLFWVSD